MSNASTLRERLGRPAAIPADRPNPSAIHAEVAFIRNGAIENPVTLVRAIMAFGIRLKDAHEIVTDLVASPMSEKPVFREVGSPVCLNALSHFNGLGVKVILMVRSPIEQTRGVDIPLSSIPIHEEIWLLEKEREIELYN